MAYMGALSLSPPLRKGRLMTNRYSRVTPPDCSMSWPAAAAEPPVAIRSLHVSSLFSYIVLQDPSTPPSPVLPLIDVSTM
jgi:hypothetical protein